MSKTHRNKSRKVKPQLKKIKTKCGLTEYRINTNDFTVLYIQRPGSGVITTNIVYNVGSSDEARGETGIAHMLEHMLFKPTTFDLKRRSQSAAMAFERDLGVILNASTWRDRTNYFFSYPKEHFRRALQIEAERMHDVALTNKEFLPEQGNVLSEHDMYQGYETFVLSQALCATAFHAHPYGHETIGFRNDIENFNIEKLYNFYKKYYTPNNATLIIVGDISEKEMRSSVLEFFGNIKMTNENLVRNEFVELKQEGVRKITIKRKSIKQVLGFGLRHDKLPTKNWFETFTVLNMLAGDSDSILHKAFVDTGIATSISVNIDPTRNPSIAELFVTLTDSSSHEKVERKVHQIISKLTVKHIAPSLKRTIFQTLLSESKQRESSLGFATELMEYVSAGDWEAFFDSEKIIKSISPVNIMTRMHEMFDENKLIVGYFKGTA